MAGEASNMEVEVDAPATTEAAKGIKAIDKTTVHRICSGQVVLTLAIAVKELVENSLDAGATSVEVRLKDQGATLLEVADNGRGVEEHDFEGLTLKHHTSKIQDFGDVVGVKTFGFRGEALSSLCALSDLTITTRHTASPVATKLTYDRNGVLTSRTATSRQVGTTVTLQGLFSPLPVRHKEFVRNIKREFNKMVQVLYSYCLISTGVRITCTNQNEKGKKTVVVSTSGHPTIKENLSSIFGAKQAASLLEFRQEAASEEVLEEYGIREAAVGAGEPHFRLEGLVSSCAHGQGRATTDRQFYFINARPCDPAKVMRLVNDVYHQYNRYQAPCVVLNIQLHQDSVDINVTPDKRQIMVSREKLLLATIKTSLGRIYEGIPNTYALQNTSLTPTQKMTPSPSPSLTPTLSPTTPPSSGKISALTQRFGRHSGTVSSPHPGTPLSRLKRPLANGSDTLASDRKQPKLLNFLKQSPAEVAAEGTTTTTKPLDDDGVCPLPPTDDGEEERGMGETEEGEEEMDVEGKNQEEDRKDSVVNDDGKELNASLTTTINGNVDGNKDNDTNLATNNDGDDNTTNNTSSTLIESSHTQNDDNAETVPSSESRAHTSTSSSPLNTPSTSTPFSLSSFSYTPATSVGKSTSHSTPVRPIHQAPSSSKCKKIHTTTNDFLNNLKAKRCLINNDKNNDAQKERETVRESENGGMDDNRHQRGIGAEREGVNGVDDDGLEILYEGLEDNGMSEEGRQEKQVSKKIVVCEEYDPKLQKGQRKCRSVPFDIASLRTRLQKRARKEEKKGEKSLVRRFRAKISPTDNTSAEEELNKAISKDMFAKMEVLGQFNLGFIIARLDQDLFIIDQHATDEKYNFETLQNTCVLRNQRLIAPQTLELTAVGEATLLDNVEIFHKNGFEFKVREDEPAGRRVQLVSMPVSRGWEFNRSDVEELVFMLSDAPGVMCRPSRVRAMFASRACRKSVMIGTALTHQQMKTLVNHMGEIEQPWNCPHGRPTMRHLVNLSLVVPLS